MGTRTFGSPSLFAFGQPKPVFGPATDTAKKDAPFSFGPAPVSTKEENPFSFGPFFSTRRRGRDPLSFGPAPEFAAENKIEFEDENYENDESDESEENEEDPDDPEDFFSALFGAIFGPTQKEKNALVATLTAQKDTFPSMILIRFPLSPFAHPLCFPVVEQLIKCPMCSKTFSDPRTLSCLHSFCLACLEAQQFTAKSKSSDLRCHQCSAPFTLPSIGGVDAFACNAFIDSLVKSA